MCCILYYFKQLDQALNLVIWFIIEIIKNIIVSINGQTEKNALSSMIDNLVVRDTKKIREESWKIKN